MWDLAIIRDVLQPLRLFAIMGIYGDRLYEIFMWTLAIIREVSLMVGEQSAYDTVHRTAIFIWVWPLQTPWIFRDLLMVLYMAGSKVIRHRMLHGTVRYRT